MTKEIFLGGLGGLWTATAGLADFAVNMEPVKALGAQLDRATVGLKNAIFAEPFIFVAITIFMLGAAVWNKSRGRGSGGMFKRAFAVTLTIAFIGMMGVGAAASTGGGDKPYVPGVGSPGWLLTKTQDFIGAGTNAAINSLSGLTLSDPSTVASANGLTGQMNCANYMQGVEKERKKISSQAGNTLMSVSALWEATALRTWAAVQFGSANPYVDKVWCHYADQAIGVSPAMQEKLTREGVSNLPPAGNGSKAFRQTSNHDTAKSMIAWAACNWDGSKWVVEPGFATRSDGEAWVSPDACAGWWSGDASTNLDGPGSLNAIHANNWFNVGIGEPTTAQVDDYTDDEAVKNFVNTWQVGDGFAALGIITFALLSSLIMFLILGLAIPGAVIIAKFLAVFTVMTMVILLLASLFTRGGPGAQMAQLAKQIVGFTVLASAGSLIFILVTWMTRATVALGASVFDPGSPISILWVGLAPIGAMISLHFLFKKTLKKPSPLTLSGALAWGGAAGAAGAAVTNAVQGRFQRGAQRAASAATDKARDRLGIGSTRANAGGPGNAPAAARPGAGQVPKNEKKGGPKPIDPKSVGGPKKPGNTEAAPGTSPASELEKNGAPDATPGTPGAPSEQKSTDVPATKPGTPKPETKTKFGEQVQARFKSLKAGVARAYEAPVATAKDLGKRLATNAAKASKVGAVVGAAGIVGGVGGVAAVGAVYGAKKGVDKIRQVRTDKAAREITELREAQAKAAAVRDKKAAAARAEAKAAEAAAAAQRDASDQAAAAAARQKAADSRRARAEAKAQAEKDAYRMEQRRAIRAARGGQQTRYIPQRAPKPTRR